MQETIEKLKVIEKEQEERIAFEKAQLARELAKAREELNAKKKSAEKLALDLIEKEVEKAMNKALEETKKLEELSSSEIAELEKKRAENEPRAIFAIIEEFTKWR